MEYRTIYVLVQRISVRHEPGTCIFPFIVHPCVSLLPNHIYPPCLIPLIPPPLLFAVDQVCVVAMLHEVYVNPHYLYMWGNFPESGKGGLVISFWVWVHYHNKYVELLDTVFMIVRKKNSQASFLHCYHHVLLIWSWFLVVKVSAGGDSYFGGMVNSFIHVIMYAYYTMPIIGIKVPLFLKKSITNCQKLQFCICLVHAVYVSFKGTCPLVLPATQAFVMINMLVLFTQFSNKAYAKKKQKEEVDIKVLKPTSSEDELSCPARLD